MRMFFNILWGANGRKNCNSLGVVDNRGMKEYEAEVKVEVFPTGDRPSDRAAGRVYTAVFRVSRNETVKDVLRQRLPDGTVFNVTATRRCEFGWWWGRTL